MPTLDPALLAVGALAGATLLAVYIAGRSLFGRSDRVLERLQRSAPGAVAGPRVLTAGSAQPLATTPISGSGARPRPAGRLELHRQLVQAGFRDARALRRVLVAKGVAAVAAPMLFVLFGLDESVAPGSIVPLLLALCAVGLYAPNLWLYSRVRSRQQTIERALPETMDLLVTCVEAGLGLDAALARVAAETMLSAPALAGELNLTFLEIQAGIPRIEAFRRLADRTGVEELRSLAATLAQTELFGTSIAAALRMRADWIRTRRMQRAEERAAVVAVKMTVPLVFCILPSLLAVVMGPAVVGIARSLLPALGGGGQ